MNPVAATMPAGIKQLASAAVAAPQFAADWLRPPPAEAEAEPKPRTVVLDLAGEQKLRDKAAARQPESELRLLSAALMTMQETERKRIATDLHDSIGQSLSALSFGICAALDGTRQGNVQMASEMLVRLASQVKEAIVEVQRIAMDLRPATLDDIGLVGTLSWFFREFRAIHPGMALNADVDLEECDVPPALRTNIFRVIQEAVSNIVKHAQASEIRIGLRRKEREIHLEVADNGVGFGDTVEDMGPTVATRSGMGLKGMRDRAECSGGRFCLVSVPGKGTRIFVAWPHPAE